MIYSNKTESEIALKRDLDELTKKNLNFKIIHTITRPEESPEWNGVTGRIDEKMIREHSDLTETFYVCGPPQMVDGTVAILKAMNIPPAQIKFEKFTGY
jgi:ferredoxin-NADP reductase